MSGVLRGLRSVVEEVDVRDQASRPSPRGHHAEAPAVHLLQRPHDLLLGARVVAVAHGAGVELRALRKGLLDSLRKLQLADVIDAPERGCSGGYREHRAVRSPSLDPRVVLAYTAVDESVVVAVVQHVKQLHRQPQVVAVGVAILQHVNGLAPRDGDEDVAGRDGRGGDEAPACGGLPELQMDPAALAESLGKQRPRILQRYAVLLGDDPEASGATSFPSGRLTRIVAGAGEGSHAPRTGVPSERRPPRDTMPRTQGDTPQRHGARGRHHAASYTRRFCVGPTRCRGHSFTRSAALSVQLG